MFFLVVLILSRVFDDVSYVVLIHALASKLSIILLTPIFHLSRLRGASMSVIQYLHPYHLTRDKNALMYVMFVLVSPKPHLPCYVLPSTATVHKCLKCVEVYQSSLGHTRLIKTSLHKYMAQWSSVAL